MADVKAVTRIEAILNGEDITPVTREEAILSGADVEPLSREEYFVQKRLGEGGGGGLDYVIPEQTVTFESEGHDIFAVLENVNIEGLEINDHVILKNKNVVEDEVVNEYYIGTLQTVKRINFGSGTIVYDDNQQRWEISFVDGPPAGYTTTFAAISGF